MPVTIKREKGDTESQMIAKFKRQTQDIIDEVKERQFHKTKAQERKERMKYLKSKHWRK